MLRSSLGFRCGRGVFDDLRRVGAPKDLKDLRTVEAELSCAHARDLGQVPLARGLTLGDRREGGVGEDDVCRHAGRARGGQAPFTQALEGGLVVAGWALVAAAGLALRGGHELGAAAAALRWQGRSEGRPLGGAPGAAAWGTGPVAEDAR